jgi:hypothetical protein
MDSELTGIHQWTQLLQRHLDKLNQPNPLLHKVACLGLGHCPERLKQLD